MKKKLLAMMLAGMMGASLLTGCGSSEDTTAAASTESETVEATEDDMEEAEAETETEDAESSFEDVRFVDGFYATDGNTDFMIAFYEGASGDIAYVNDGTNEVFAEYTVENAQLDDGTEFLLVTVGAMQMGYFENGEEIYLVDDEGTVYGAARLTAEEADALAEAASN